MDHAEAVSITELVDERRYLLDVARRLLGGGGEAEWAVDETYRRWYALPDAVRDRIAAPRAWLERTAGAICLELLVRPDRLEGGTRAAGTDHVLGTTTGTIAAVAGRVGAGRPVFADLVHERLRGQGDHSASAQRHDTVARALRQACLTQDEVLLASLLCPHVTAFFDGGGKLRALIRPVHGRPEVAHSLLTFLAGRTRTALTNQLVNGRTGLVVRYDGQVVTVISIDVSDREITQVWAVLNPDKLRTWNRRARPVAGPGPATPSPTGATGDGAARPAGDERAH
ncbi:RNA polymerase subunit sigma [Streptomyces cadmiisoli]|uniref:RNA polymerase subunit sigma n=1 Tax=Streptomyces cadmiisoli TaxID=2184053 RepID=UPI003D76595D